MFTTVRICPDNKQMLNHHFSQRKRERKNFKLCKDCLKWKKLICCLCLYQWKWNGLCNILILTYIVLSSNSIAEFWVSWRMGIISYTHSIMFWVHHFNYSRSVSCDCCCRQSLLRKRQRAVHTWSISNCSTYRRGIQQVHLQGWFLSN